LLRWLLGERLVQVLQNTIARPVTGVSFTQAGRTLVAGGSGGIHVWNLATATHTFIASHAVKYLFGFICDPAGRWVYVSDYIAGFRLVPLLTHDAIPVPGSPDETHVRAFDLTPNGKRLILSRGGGTDNRVECWNVRPTGALSPAWSLLDGKSIPSDEPYLLNQSKWNTNGVAIFPNGKTIAAAENRATSISGECPLIALRDGSTGKIIADLGPSDVGFDTRLAAAPDGRAVYVWDTTALERWDVKAGKRTAHIPAAGRAFQGLAIHPTRRVVITVSSDGNARTWDPLDLTLLDTLKVSATKLHSLAINSTGTLAAAGGEKGQVFVWDLD
jgi:WD40 repeat protein